MKPLPKPIFIDANPAAATSRLIAAFEQASGIVLQPAQVERLMVDVAAYETTLIRQGIQEAALQNLVRYARFPMLDHLGELMGVERLDEQPATVPMAYALTAVQPLPVVIPAGNRVESKDGKVIFATAEALTIPAGQTTGTVKAVAQTAGIIGNGYLAGEVATVLDPIANVATAANTATTQDGFDVEDDDRYRERIMLAPEAFSTGGSKGAYRFHALSAHQSITDVVVVRGDEAQVFVYVLTATGAPSQAILDLVEAKLNDETVRPCSDTVLVLAPTAVDYALVVDVTRYNAADEDFLVETITAKLEAFVAGRRALLGGDIVPSQHIGVAAPVEGVYKVELPGLVETVVEANAYPNCTGITVNVVGTTNG
jgi:phage-related baseplate assembly protein